MGSCEEEEEEEVVVVVVRERSRESQSILRGFLGKKGVRRLKENRGDREAGLTPLRARLRRELVRLPPSLTSSRKVGR